MKIPKIPDGYKRQWVKCKICNRAAYYDYVPYSLSYPIMILPCGHGAGERFDEASIRITETEGKQLLRTQRSA